MSIVYQGPYIIDFGLNFDGDISASVGCRWGVTPNPLLKLWRIDKEAAKNTLEIITQLKKHEVNGPLTRNFFTNNSMIQYRRINKHFFTDTFFFTKKVKSACGNTCMQLFVSEKGFVFIVPMKSWSKFSNDLKLFAKEIGVLT